MKGRLREVAQTAGGRLVGADADFSGISTDSRSLPAGALFVALRGPNFDGGDFVAAAAAAGAAGVVVDREVAVDLPQIVVSDTLAALQAVSARWRSRFSLPVIAVAGSNGKTTTKEMIGAILAERGASIATRGSLNNHIGVPLTLLRLDVAHCSAVVEIGANHPGEVAELMHLVQPTVSVVTNAGAEHLEGFGDLDGVARAEGEAFVELRHGGTAVINADDPYAGYWRGLASSHRVQTFGMREPADYRATNLQQGIEAGEFRSHFLLECPLGTAPITLHAGGAHNVQNALAAAAAAGSAGATLAEIAAGLTAFRPVSGRLQLKAGAHGEWIIDDSYNANPSSVMAGLDVLRSLPGVGWLVLGEMAELGGQTAACHGDIGRYARQAGVQRLFATGTAALAAAESFGAGAEWLADTDLLIGRLRAEIAPGTTVLVKGSRINRLERVVQALIGAPFDPANAAH